MREKDLMKGEKHEVSDSKLGLPISNLIDGEDCARNLIFSDDNDASAFGDVDFEIIAKTLQDMASFANISIVSVTVVNSILQTLH